MKRLLLCTVLAACALAQDQPKIDQLIESLGDDSPEVRDKSQGELLKLGKAAIPKLCAAYQSATDPEVKERLWVLLQRQTSLALEYLESSDKTLEFKGLIEKLSEEELHSIIREHAGGHVVETTQPDFALDGSATLYWLDGGTGCFSRGVLEIGILKLGRDGDGKYFTIAYDGNFTKVTVKGCSISAARGKRILNLVRKATGLKVLEKKRTSHWSMTAYDYKQVLLFLEGKKVYEKSFGGMIGTRNETDRAFFAIVFKGILERSLKDLESAECTLDAEVANDFLKIIKDTDPKGEWWVKNLLVETAYKINRKEALPFIKQLILAGDEYIERSAAALDPEDFDPFLECLEAKQTAARAKACEMFAQTENPKYAKAISPLLRDPDASVRRSACAALRRLNATECSAAVAKLLSDSDAGVRKEAAQCIGTLGAKDFADQVAKLLADTDPLVQGAACIALGSLGAVKHAAAVAALLNSADADVCRAACVTVGKLGASEHAGDIAKLLGHKNEWVKIAACGVLADLGAKNHAREAARLLSDEEEYVRREACAALGKMGAVECAKEVADRLKDSTASVRIEACKALAAFKAKEYADGIIAQWNYEGMNSRDDHDLGQAVSDALVELAAGDRGEQIASYLGSKNEYARAFACKTLGRLGLSCYAKQIAALLSDEKEWVKQCSIETLAEFKAVEYRGNLEKLLEDKDVKFYAAIALLKMGFRSGIKVIEDELRNHFSTSAVDELMKLRYQCDPYQITVRSEGYRLMNVGTLAAELKDNGFELVIQHDVREKLKDQRFRVRGSSLSHVMDDFHRWTEGQVYYILEGKKITLLPVDQVKRFWLEWLEEP